MDWEGEAHAEPTMKQAVRLGRSLALPDHQAILAVGMALTARLSFHLISRSRLDA
jgi:hypothetical protein